MFKSFRYRLRPSRTLSAFTAVFGIGMLIFGVTTISVKGGSFMILWVGGLLAIILYHLANALGLRVPALFAVESENADRNAKQVGSAAALRDLEALRADGLVSDEEYAAKRAEIMGQRWS